MEIEIHTSDVKKFNYVLFQNSIGSILSSIDHSLNTKAIINIVADLTNQYYIDRHRRESETSIKLINRNILYEDKLLIHHNNQDDNPDNVVMLDKVVRGIMRNYPRFCDVTIGGFHNDPDSHIQFSDDDLSNPMQLYKKLAQYSLLADLVKQTTYTSQQWVANTPKTIKPIESSVEIGAKALTAINNMLYCNYRTNIDARFIGDAFLKLSSVGLSHVIKWLIADDLDKIKQSLAMARTTLIADKIAINTKYKEIYLDSSIIIALKRMLVREVKDYDKYLTLITKYNITNYDQFENYLSDAEKKKMKTLMQRRTESITLKHCELHTVAIDSFINNKYSTIDIGNIAVLNEITKQYSCKLCKVDVLCKHFIDGRINKESMINEYRGEIDKQITYCKYCHGAIFNDSMSDIMSDRDFVFIQKARASASMEGTEVGRLSPLIYSGVANAVSYFSSTKEFSQTELIKNINQIVYPQVTDVLSELGVKDEKINEVTPVYAFIYTVIYMMDICLSNPILFVKGSPKLKTRMEYAKHFTDVIAQRYNLVSKEMIRDIIKKAYIGLEDEYRSAIRFSDENTKYIIISESPIYLFLYNLYVSNSLKSKQPVLSPLRMIPIITGYTGKDITTVNFYNKYITPPGMSDEDKDLYTYLVDYRDPRCSVYKLSNTNIHPEYKGVNTSASFDPSLETKLAESEIRLRKQRRVVSFTNNINNVCKYPFNKCFPVEFIYNQGGKIIQWIPQRATSTKKVAKRSRCGMFINESVYDIDFVDDEKTVLSKIEPLNQEKRIDRVKRRNEVIKFKPSNMRATTIPKPTQIKKKETKSNFMFDTKKIMELKDLTRNHLNYIKYLGRTEGYTDRDVRVGLNLPPITDDDHCLTRVDYYNNYLIRRYYSFVNQPTDSQNISIIEKSKINIADVQDISYPDIRPEGSYRLTVKKIRKQWPINDVYDWMLQYFIESIASIATVSGIGKQLAEDILSYVMFAEKTKHKMKVDIEVSGEDDIDDLSPPPLTDAEKDELDED